MRKDVRNDCEIALYEDEYEILHELRETVMNSSELLEALHGEHPYDLNIIGESGEDDRRACVKDLRKRERRRERTRLFRRPMNKHYIGIKIK